MSISFVSYKVAERDRIPDQTETERHLFPVFVFCFLKSFVFLVFSCGMENLSPSSITLRNSTGSPHVRHWTYNTLFWLGANYHRPVDLPDTTRLSWREGVFRYLGSVRARTSQPSVLPTICQSSLSADRQSCPLAAHQSSSPPSTVKSSLPPCVAHSKQSYFLPTDPKSSSLAVPQTSLRATTHSSSPAASDRQAWVSTQARRPFICQPACCGLSKPAGRSSAKFASCYEVKPTGCGSFQPAGHSETSACSSKARSSVCSSPRLESSHVPRSIVHRNYYFQSCRSYLVCWGS